MTEEVLSGARYQKVRMEVQGVSITPLVFNGEQETFEKIFKLHFKGLHAYAYTIVQDEMAAEEMVQNVFLKIWEKDAGAAVQLPAVPYLYKSVYNESLNYLKHRKVKEAYRSHAVHQMKNNNDHASGKVLLSELEKQLNKALAGLPEQCRTIFYMSRFEELKYHQIADKLGLSIKTVENQMGKALKILRLKLVDYLPFLIPLLIDINYFF